MNPHREVHFKTEICQRLAIDGGLYVGYDAATEGVIAGAVQGSTGHELFDHHALHGAS